METITLVVLVTVLIWCFVIMTQLYMGRRKSVLGLSLEGTIRLVESLYVWVLLILGMMYYDTVIVFFKALLL